MRSSKVKTKLILLGSMLATLTSLAQTNFIIVTRTNIIQAAPNFREVNGQLYNISFSKLWKTLNGKISVVQENGVLIQTFTTNNVYQMVFVAGEGNAGAQGSSSDRYVKRLVSSTLIPDKRLFINHYRIGAVDQDISIPAMNTGTIQISGAVFEEWDCGLPHIVTNIISQKIIK